MKIFLAFCCLLLNLQMGPDRAKFSNEHMVLEYPEDWVVRPIENTSKVNFILETEKLSIWSPLKPDEDRKTLKLTTPSSIYYKRSPSLRKINREVLKAAKDKLQEFEKVTSEEGVKEGVPYIKTVFSYKVGFGYETTEYYVFVIQETPYVLYMTSSRKEHIKQKEIWADIWSKISIQ